MKRVISMLAVMLLALCLCIPQSLQADTQADAAQTSAQQENTQAANAPASGEVTTGHPGQVVLVLDPGHGGVDSGARGNGLLEKNLTLAIVLEAKQYFDKDSRFKVLYTRTADTYPSLKDRCKLANTNNADMFICVHINSYRKGSTGTETLYSMPRNASTMKNGLTSSELAASMQMVAVRSTGFPDRGLVNRPKLYVLKNTRMPACLIEYGFISNPTESKIIHANTARYGKELYEGIVEFMIDKGWIK